MRRWGRRWGPRWGVVRVVGRSMLPTLRPGDWLVVRWGAAVRPGDLVVVRLPDRPLSVKRAGVRDVTLGGGGWWVESDNPVEGTDSWTLGAPVADADVLGVVALRPWPIPGPGRSFRRSGRD